MFAMYQMMRDAIDDCQLNGPGDREIKDHSENEACYFTIALLVTFQQVLEPRNINFTAKIPGAGFRSCRKAFNIS